MKTNHLLKVSFACILIVLSVTSCNNKKQTDDSKILADTDRFYSALSAEKGMNAAFLAMFIRLAVLLRANEMPIEGLKQ